MRKTTNRDNTSAQQVDHDKREEAILELARELLDTVKGPLTAIIDAAFYFQFEPTVVKRIQEIRERFLGRVDPFPTDEESEAWFKRTLGTRRDTKRNMAWLEEMRKLATDYCIRADDVALLVLRGKAPAISWINISHIKQDELGRPYTELRIYGQPALDALRTGRDVYDFTKGFPGELAWEHRYLGDRYGEGPWRRKKKTQKAMAPSTRIRTWTIYYLSKAGGGRRTFNQAIEIWNGKIEIWSRKIKRYDRHYLLALTVDAATHRRRLQRDIREVTGTMEWLTRRDELIGKHFQAMVANGNTAL